MRAGGGVGGEGARGSGHALAAFILSKHLRKVGWGGGGGVVGTH